MGARSRVPGRAGRCTALATTAAAGPLPGLPSLLALGAASLLLGLGAISCEPGEPRLDPLKLLNDGVGWVATAGRICWRPFGDVGLLDDADILLPRLPMEASFWVGRVYCRLEADWFLVGSG